MQLDDVVSELQIPFLPENGRRTAARTAQASSPRTELTGQKYVIVKSKNIKRARFHNRLCVHASDPAGTWQLCVRESVSEPVRAESLFHASFMPVG